MLASENKIKQRHVGGPDMRVARWGWSNSGANYGLRDIFHITPLWIGGPNDDKKRFTATLAFPTR